MVRQAGSQPVDLLTLRGSASNTPAIDRLREARIPRSPMARPTCTPPGIPGHRRADSHRDVLQRDRHPSLTAKTVTGGRLNTGGF